MCAGKAGGSLLGNLPPLKAPGAALSTNPPQKITASPPSPVDSLEEDSDLEVSEGEEVTYAQVVEGRHKSPVSEKEDLLQEGASITVAPSSADNEALEVCASLRSDLFFCSKLLVFTDLALAVDRRLRLPPVLHFPPEDAMRRLGSPCKAKKVCLLCPGWRRTLLTRGMLVEMSVQAKVRVNRMLETPKGGLRTMVELLVSGECSPG